MRIKIKDATREQLLNFLQTRINLRGLKPNTGKPRLLELVEKHWTEDFIEVEHDAKDAGPRATRAVEAAPPPKGKIDPVRFAALDPRWTISIANEKTKYGKRNVGVFVNGIPFYIPRGRPVEVPHRYFLALKEAIGDDHPGWDPETERNSEPIEVESYSVSVIRAPTEEEIAAYEKAMAPHFQKQRVAKMKRILRNRKERMEDDGTLAA